MTMLMRTHVRCREIEALLTSRIKDLEAEIASIRDAAASSASASADEVRQLLDRNRDLLDRILLLSGSGRAVPAPTSPAAVSTDPAVPRPVLPRPRPFPILTPQRAGFRPVASAAESIDALKKEVAGGTDSMVPTPVPASAPSSSSD